MKLAYLLVILATLFLTGCKFNGSTSSPQPLPADPGPPPIVAPSRRGLYFGYFGADDNQIDETKDHVNFYFEAMWSDLDPAIDRMNRMDLPTVLAITPWVYGSTNGNGIWDHYLGTETVTKNLRELFDKLRAYRCLNRIIVLYPLDEPELNGISADVIEQANKDIRSVMNEYEELKDAKLMVTYQGTELYPGIEYYDIVGFDDYDMREGIFIPGGKYDRLRERLRDDQMLTLFPGGANPWRTDPTEFYQKAQTDDKVWGIIPFIWLDYAGGSTELGIKSNRLATWYAAYGKEIKNAN